MTEENIRGLSSRIHLLEKQVEKLKSDLAEKDHAIEFLHRENINLSSVIEKMCGVVELLLRKEKSDD